MLIGIANLQDSATHQFQVDCKYLVTSSTKPAKSARALPNKVELPMENGFCRRRGSNWREPAVRKAIGVSPPLTTPTVTSPIVYWRAAQSESGCNTNSWGGLITMSTPVTAVMISYARMEARVQRSS